MRHTSMSATDPLPGSAGRFGRTARVLAIPVAVLVAIGGYTAAPVSADPGVFGSQRRTASSESVPMSSFNGSSTSVGPFRVEVEVAYTDSTVTDGMGTHATAPSGMTYYIYRLNVTNEGSSPAIFDSHGTRGHTPDGTSYANDVEAEVTVAWDYFWDEINPGVTVTTHLMFLAPEGTEFSYVEVSGQSDLRPS